MLNCQGGRGCEGASEERQETLGSDSVTGGLRVPTWALGSPNKRSLAPVSSTAMEETSNVKSREGLSVAISGGEANECVQEPQVCLQGTNMRVRFFERL